jgi:ditrans,polycis-polyprenyl diphosphate synthase
LILYEIQAVFLLRNYLQASENVQLHFITTYWPEVDFWDLFPIILDYQAKVWSREGSKAGVESGR